MTTIMESIDLLNYLSSIGVGYREHGKNIGQGFIGICCPLCNDNNYHLGVNIDKKYFNCWRCSNGGNFIKLIMLLEDIPLYEAIKKAESLSFALKTYETIDISKIVSDIFKKTPEIVDEIKNNITFKIQDNMLYQNDKKIGIHISQTNKLSMFYKYLVLKRKFDFDFILNQEIFYNVKNNCLLFPIKLYNEIVTIQQRFILDSKKYKAFPKEDSLISIKESLYLYDEYEVNDIVFICEGVFDTLRLKSFGYKSISLFGKSVSANQAYLLLQKPPKIIYVILDKDAYNDSVITSNFLNDIGLSSTPLRLTKYKDPDSSDKNYIKTLLP